MLTTYLGYGNQNLTRQYSRKHIREFPTIHGATQKTEDQLQIFIYIYVAVTAIKL